MNSRGHLIISSIKSMVRIFACILAVFAPINKLEILAIGLLVAEVLGIFEELVDKR